MFIFNWVTYSSVDVEVTGAAVDVEDVVDDVLLDELEVVTAEFGLFCESVSDREPGVFVTVETAAPIQTPHVNGHHSANFARAARSGCLQYATTAGHGASSPRVISGSASKHFAVDVVVEPSAGAVEGQNSVPTGQEPGFAKTGSPVHLPKFTIVEGTIVRDVLI